MTTLTLPSITALANAAQVLARAAQDAEDTQNMNALNKAMWQLHQGVKPLPTTGGFLVPSGTLGGVVHRISNVYGCSCEAGAHGRPCWHQALIEVIEVAAQLASPAYDEALEAVSELFA
jgi:hypothetical protein